MSTTEAIFQEIIKSDLFRTDGKEIDLCERLGALVDTVAAEEENDWYIGEGDTCTLDSLLVGAYWALADCHGGQSSPEYEALCKVGTIFDPGRTNLDKDSPEFFVYEAVVDYLNPGTTEPWEV